MPNRTQPPPIHTFNRLELPRPREVELRNGWKGYLIDKGTQEVVRIEAVFWAGRPYEHKQMVARATLQMLKEGAGSYNSSQLSEAFDYHGATLNVPYHTDTGNIVLYSLNRHLNITLPLFATSLAEPLFPQRELDSFIRRNQQSLREELQKNDVLAYREITEHCYGADHPYGYNSSFESYAQLEVADLRRHHERHIHAGNGFLLVSGRITPEVEKLLDQYLGALPTRPTYPITPPAFPTHPPRTLRIDRPDRLQTAIRLLRPLFRRDHPDYPGVYVLNTIFGGYFGSRLMENIREQKGYTYHIGSSIDTMRFGGALHIDAEVGNEQVEATLHELRAEMARLRNELVSQQELEMVRNYLMGNFLTMLDGPFNLSEVILTLLTEEVSLDFFEHLVQTVTTIDSTQIRELANRYLHPEEYWVISVGA